jgi:hypothetical protein
MTIGQINKMPTSEYLGWQQFYMIEPWGLRTEDAMHAHAISVLANINRDTKVRKEPFQIKDFLLYKEPEPVTAEEDEPTVEGKTSAQWKLIFAAEALIAQQQMKAG